MVKHPSVKHAVLCDIDDVVIEQSKVHLKHLSCGFEVCTPAAAAAAADLRFGVLLLLLLW